MSTGDLKEETSFSATRIGAIWESNIEGTTLLSSPFQSVTESSSGTGIVSRGHGNSVNQLSRPTYSNGMTSDPAMHYAVRKAVRQAIDYAENMVQASLTDDAIGISIAGFQLLSSLEELWRLRRNREDNWCDLVNLLQGALSCEDFESYTRSKCDAVKEVVSEHLRLWTVEDDDLRASIAVLRRAGLDPWKGISGTPQED